MADLTPTTYYRLPRAVDAVQFFAAVTPWPPGVDDCGAIDGPHLHVVDSTLAPAIVFPVHDTDYVVHEHGALTVLSAAQFDATFADTAHYFEHFEHAAAGRPADPTD